jgi:pyridoxal phosphate enzyme (YggS family)
MAEAAQRAGRSPDEIRLTAVTKYVTSDKARLLWQAGCHDLGESRPQELWSKVADLGDLDLRWHMIGHLQRNKLARTLPVVSLVQSVDSLRLLRAIQKWAAQHDRCVPILIEVNVSADPEKHGFDPATVIDAVGQASESANVEPQGLMCMASREGGLTTARRDFASLRKLRDELRDQLPDGSPLSELSMGMSRDFPVAIEEGATIVRVGSTLFEGIDRA